MHLTSPDMAFATWALVAAATAIVASVFTGFILYALFRHRPMAQE
jgi:hypothetical protein